MEVKSEAGLSFEDWSCSKVGRLVQDHGLLDGLVGSRMLFLNFPRKCRTISYSNHPDKQSTCKLERKRQCKLKVIQILYT